MKSIWLSALSLLLISAGGALADPWAGQNVTLLPIPDPVNNGSLAPVNESNIHHMIAFCASPSGPSPPPCTAGQQLSYRAATQYKLISGLPGGVDDPNSQVVINAVGYYADPGSPSGISRIYTNIPLSDFATADSVDAVMDQMNQGFAQIQSQMNQQRSLLSHYAAQGVAQAIALGGVGDIGSDEKFAINGGFGSYDGQSAAAVGFAVRVSQHMSFNAGMSGMGASHYGVRAGFHMGW